MECGILFFFSVFMAEIIKSYKLNMTRLNVEIRKCQRVNITGCVLADDLAIVVKSRKRITKKI